LVKTLCPQNHHKKKICTGKRVRGKGVGGFLSEKIQKEQQKKSEEKKEKTAETSKSPPT